MEGHMVQHRIVVKGNRFEVARFTADRGIPFVFESETPADGVFLTKPETHGTVDISTSQLQIWEEQNELDAEFGPGIVPVGTLLHYERI